MVTQQISNRPNIGTLITDFSPRRILSQQLNMVKFKADREEDF